MSQPPTRVTRRRLLQIGAVGAAGTVLRPRSGRDAPAIAASRSASSAADFSRPLPQPSILVPRSSDADGEHYEIEMRPGAAEMLPGISTPIWGYEGTYPGPTILATRNRQVTVLQRNNLSEPTAVHLHGANVAAAHDGHPRDAIAPGAERLYVYPNRQAASTLWYHDHAMMMTGPHVYRGLAGLYLIDDPNDSALGLPSGDRDVPLVLADRTFDGDGNLVYDNHDHMGVVGSHVLVNGVHAPVFTVAPTTYRFRILNGSNATLYDLELHPLDADGTSTGAIRVPQIASDGGLLAAPVRFRTLPIFPAERVEIVFDFSAFAPGSSIALHDALRGTDLLRFDVAGSAPTPPALPPTLRDIVTLPAPVATRSVSLDFDQASGTWLLNGAGFDAERFDAQPRLGSVERWELTNTTHMTHPIHLHLVMFQVLARSGGVVPDRERGWKDTVAVAPGETVAIAARFGDHAGPFVYHCHILEHEDHDMMSQFRVVDLHRLAGSGRAATAAAISAATFAPGVPVVFIATSGGFADALAGGPEAARLGGPVLLTDPETLPPATEEELVRARPARVVVLGGPKAVTAQVEERIRQLTGVEVTRLHGADRFATAAAVSSAHHAPGVGTVYVATGDDYPDALAGGVLAGRDEAPMLLVRHADVPEPTRVELQRLAPGRIVVLGGPKAVSDAVVEHLATYADGGSERLSGASRFETAAAVSKRAFGAGSDVAVIATGRAFPDALAGVPAAHREQGPLLLVEPTSIPAATSEELRRLGPRRILVLGGPKAVDAAVEEALVGYLRDP